MNDWWNDPPDDEVEIACPLCGCAYEKDSMDEMVSAYNSHIVCTDCAHSWCPAELDAEANNAFAAEHNHDLPLVFYPDNDSQLCPHGHKWGDCGSCDRASDFAYDAARESRYAVK